MEFHFHTGVHHVTDIVIVAHEAERSGKSEIHEHIGSAAVVTVDFTAEAVIEEAEFDTGVEVTVLLPGYILVAEVRGSYSWMTARVDKRVCVGIKEFADIVVACSP